MRIPGLLLGLLIGAELPIAAQTADSIRNGSDPVIQDNSFLVEEAYNQEAGIVQHISTFQIQRGTSDFDASFTQEWPVGSIKHQLSYDIPVSRIGSHTGLTADCYCFFSSFLAFSTAALSAAALSFSVFDFRVPALSR